MYGIDSGKPTELNVVYDLASEDEKQFAGILALLPQSKPANTRKARNSAFSRSHTTTMNSRRFAAHKKGGLSNCMQQPSQRKKTDIEKRFENINPIPDDKDDKDFVELRQKYSE